MIRQIRLGRQAVTCFIFSKMKQLQSILSHEDVFGGANWVASFTVMNYVRQCNSMHLQAVFIDLSKIQVVCDFLWVRWTWIERTVWASMLGSDCIHFHTCFSAYFQFDCHKIEADMAEVWKSWNITKKICSWDEKVGHKVKYFIGNRKSNDIPISCNLTLLEYQ